MRQWYTHSLLEYHFPLSQQGLILICVCLSIFNNFIQLLFKVFSKKCIFAFQNYKKQLAQIKAEIQKQIAILNSLDCLTPEEKQACLDRLIKLQSKVDALIKLIQKCLKKFFQIKIAQMNAIKQSLVQKITFAKLQAQSKSHSTNINPMSTLYFDFLKSIQENCNFSKFCFLNDIESHLLWLNKISFLRFQSRRWGL